MSFLTGFVHLNKYHTYQAHYGIRVSVRGSADRKRKGVAVTERYTGETLQYQQSNREDSL